jgi:glucokinase
VALADRAEPIGCGPCMTVDQTREPDMGAVTNWVSQVFGEPDAHAYLR